MSSYFVMHNHVLQQSTQLHVVDVLGPRSIWSTDSIYSSTETQHEVGHTTCVYVEILVISSLHVSA